MNKRKYIILTVVVLLVTAVFMGIWLYRHFRPTADVSEYNTYATAYAYGSSLIGQQDMLILHSITRNADGNSVAEFYIYRLPTGGNAQDYMGMRTSEIGDTLEKMGTANCTFVDDNPAAVHNLTAIYLR